jgi:hypothetical protein
LSGVPVDAQYGFLAEASALLTENYGWAKPLKALVHYVQGGIVDTGFKGELITKIICLMAMDNALYEIDVPANQWKYSRPIPVSDFLNHLIVPLKGYSQFSEGLKGIQDRDNIPKGTLNVDDEKLQRFLHGYVFFNHFIHIDIKLSYSILVHAWNRGAAIMCMTNTKGINYAIPVILDTTGDIIFGPLHRPWEKEHIQQARQHISYILINSRNYASGRDQIQAAWDAKFSAQNLREYGDGFQGDQATELDSSKETQGEDFDIDSQYILQDDDEPNTPDGIDEEMKDAEIQELEMDNVFLSLVQDFGQKRVKEPWVTVGRVLDTPSHPRRAHQSRKQLPLETQFIIILKGIDVDTYECLKDNLPQSDYWSSNKLRESRSSLTELASARVDYVDKKEKMKQVAGMQNIPLVYGDSMLGSENWERCRPELEHSWRAEQEERGGAVQGLQSQIDIEEDVDFADSMDEVESTSSMT